MKKILIICLVILPIVTIAQRKTKKTERYKDSRQKKEEKIFEYNKLVLCTQWYESGQMSSVKRYKEGKNDGKHIEWYENGQMKSEAEYGMDTMKGYTVWYDNGDIKMQQEFNNGRLVKQSDWPPDHSGKTVKTFGPNRGDYTLTTYYPDGRKKKEVTYVNDIVTKNIEWYQNGQKKLEETYANRRLTDKSYEWYENGQLKVETTYKDGIPLLINRWEENGQKVNVKNYQLEQESGKK